MLNIGELETIFQKRFTQAVDDWLIDNKQSDGSDFSKLDLASKLQQSCGYSRSCLYRWMEGNGVPSLQNLLSTAEFFKRDVAFFIDKDWSMVRVHHLSGKEKSFLIDTRLLEKKPNPNLFFVKTEVIINEINAKKGDKIILAKTNKVTKDGYYLLEGYTDATKGLRYLTVEGKGKVKVRMISDSGAKQEPEVLSTKNISIAGAMMMLIHSL